MRKVWAVVRREFLERVRTRQLLIGTVLGPVFMAALFVLPALLSRNTSTKHLVVLDAAQGQFGARAEGSLRAATRNDKPDGEPRYRVERVVAADRPLEAVRDSLIGLTGRNDLGATGVDGIIVVDEEILTRDTLQYYGANVGSMNENSS